MKRFNKNILFVLPLLCILSLPLAGASYSFEGIPLTLEAQGTFRGDVYIEGGHGLSFSPYVQSFDVPEGTVRWACLYIGIWGGTENYEGWVQPEFNGQQLERTQLNGVRDKNENVYCAGHGVYWVAYEVSNLTANGLNTVEVTTSSGEPGNKLDGRVYGAVLAAACENQESPLVSYQLLAGNVNLHGKGWSGSLASVNDFAYANFSSEKISEIEAARLSVVYLTGSKGLPDYLEFNGQMLGVQPQYMASYGEKAMDIANEVSYDASGGEGNSSSYLDIEHFDVLKYLQDENSAVFIRGLDLDGNGEIDDQEGEDYLHPVLAALVLSSKSSSALPDLYPEIKIGENELVEGVVNIPFVVNNPGGACPENFTVSLLVNGSEVSSLPVRIGGSGIYRSSFSWPEAASGKYTLEVSVDPEDRIKESDEENNACTLVATVRSKPDLQVTIGDPVKVEDENESVAASLFVFPLLAFLGSKKKKPIFLAVILLFAIFSGCVGQNSTSENSVNSVYELPVTITNAGEATARNFDAGLYLDGVSVTVLDIAELTGQTSIKENLRFTAPAGEHTLCVKVDENNNIPESDEENNECEASCNLD
jgi:subtilase family serine protease